MYIKFFQACDLQLARAASPLRLSGRHVIDRHRGFPRRVPSQSLCQSVAVIANRQARTRTRVPTSGPAIFHLETSCELRALAATCTTHLAETGSSAHLTARPLPTVRRPAEVEGVVGICIHCVALTDGPAAAASWSLVGGLLYYDPSVRRLFFYFVYSYYSPSSIITLFYSPSSTDSAASRACFSKYY